MKIKKFNEAIGVNLSDESSYERPDPVIRFVESTDGDWIGMYVDGKLKRQNHNLSAKDAIFALGYTYKAIVLTEKEFDMVGGECPKTYKEAIEIKKKRKINPHSELDPYGEEVWEK